MPGYLVRTDPMLSTPMAPSGVGITGRPSRWVYSEYGKVLNAYNFVSGVTATFNTASAEDVDSKLRQLRDMRDRGLILPDDLQELEERLRTCCSLGIYKGRESNAAISGGISEGAQDWEVSWEEVNSRDQVVTKRKAFKSQAAMDKFIDRLTEKDNFLQILGTRDGVSEEAKPTTSQRQLDHLREIQPLSHTDEANEKRRKTIQARRDRKALGL